MPRLLGSPRAAYGLAAGLCLLLGVELFARVFFPWDFFLHSESPFLTDMLKLDQGQPVYSPPGDVNSYTYSPGLEYLTYALLKPLRLHLNISFCRIVTVLVGLAAAFLAARAARDMARAWWARGPRATEQTEVDQMDQMDAAPFPARLTFLAAVLVVFANFAADVPHPDNLHLLHATATLLLCLRAVRSGRLGWALAAMAVAGFGVLTKQTAALSFIGAGAGLLLARRWGAWRALLIAGTGGAAFAAGMAVLLAPEYASFWTVEVMLRHGLEPARLLDLVFCCVASPARLLLLLLAPFAIARLWRAAEGRGRQLLFPWLGLGLVEVLPNLAAFLKYGGAWNNLILLDLWLFIPVFPWLCRVGLRDAAPEGAAAAPFGERVTLALLPLFLLALVPLKLPPFPAHYDYGQALENHLRLDREAGRRVLLAHGTMPLLRAGYREVPQDRAVSHAMLRAAGLTELAETAERIRCRSYDRIYLDSQYYGFELARLLEEHYECVEMIPSANFSQGVLFMRFAYGYEGLLPTVLVYAPRRPR